MTQPNIDNTDCEIYFKVATCSNMVKCFNKTITKEKATLLIFNEKEYRCNPEHSLTVIVEL